MSGSGAHERAEEEQAREVAAAEQARLQLDRFFELSTELLGIASSRERRWLCVNPAFCRILGRSEAEILDASPLELVHPNDRARTSRGIDNVVAGASVTPFEHRMLCKNGGFRWIAWEAASQVSAGLFCCAGRDVTERRALTASAEEARARLQQGEQRLRLALEGTRQGVWEWDRARQWLFCDARCRELFGLPTAGAVTIAMHLELVHPEDRAALRHAIAKALHEPEPLSHEYRAHMPDGSVHWVLVRARASYDARGRSARLFGTAVDITKRKQAEAALRQREESYHQFFDNLQEQVLVMKTAARTREETLDPVCVDANRALLQKFGLAIDQLAGKRVSEVFGAEILRSEQPHLQRLLATGAPQSFDAEHLGRTYLVSLFNVADRFAIAAVDITDLKRAERELREAHARKDEFLAVLSHELRNPLAPIRNSLYVIEHAPADSVQSARARAVIARQVMHMSRLIDDLLDVTRIARGKIELQCEPLDLVELVARASEDQRQTFIQKDVQLRLELPTEPLCVHGDATRLSQVVGNVLQNAAKFTARGGCTTVTVERRRAQVCVRVRDTGEGLLPEMQERIFEPFAQADTSLDRQLGGLGLGLALAKGLVAMHQGEVGARSAGLGRGTEVEIRLPLIQPPAKHGRAQARPPVHPARRVLIIEDNHDAADTLRDVLELESHVVEVADAGMTGLSKARVFHPDVVLCDLGLPQMDGFEVARAIREDPKLEGIKLVALSGYALQEDVARALAAGFDAHLAKPPTVEQLERVLDAASPAELAATAMRR